MAANQTFPNQRFITVAPSSPASPNPKSGDPFRFGFRVGVALTDLDTATGNVAGDFGGVYALSVKGVNAGGNHAIAAGDPVYWTDGDTPPISAKATGYFVGQALAAVGSGATTTINVAILGVDGGTAGTS